MLGHHESVNLSLFLMPLTGCVSAIKRWDTGLSFSPSSFSLRAYVELGYYQICGREQLANVHLELSHKVLEDDSNPFLILHV
jgi:hypothetical protein